MSQQPSPITVSDAIAGAPMGVLAVGATFIRVKLQTSATKGTPTFTISSAR